jgi:hypothetical protein
MKTVFVVSYDYELNYEYQEALIGIFDNVEEAIDCFARSQSNKEIKSVCGELYIHEWKINHNYLNYCGTEPHCILSTKQDTTPKRV